MRIVSSFVSRSPFSDARTSAELKCLLAALLERQSAEVGFRSRLVERILLYVRSNAAEIRSNEDIAAAFGYHPIYVASIVKEETGKSLHSTVLEERIRLACRFLRSTDLSIEQIAFDTGFSSRSHFCTVFRRLKSVTPLAYRSGKSALTSR
jgi:AraC-like DNA-binding protein